MHGQVAIHRHYASTFDEMSRILGLAILYSKKFNFSSSVLCLFESVPPMQVESSRSVGDYEGARRSSRTALHWNIASIVSGIVSVVLSGVIIGIYFATYDPY